MTAAAHEELCRIAGPVSRETYDKLQQFESEFRRWSARINLAAPSTLGDLWRRNVLDSAQLFPLQPDAVDWLDLGSGGGFPGAVIAVLLGERAGGRVSLVESNRKKAAFLQTILGKLRAPATVFPVRIEDAPGTVPKPQVVTARALAPLPDLIGLAAPWLRAGARGLFHKGRDYRAELANCAAAWRFDLVEHRSVIDDASVILDISNVEPR
jgi:16S rRNA (guanine527-N7)-methyltransferase